MGSRGSTHFQTDRPESGGTDRHDEHEKSGLLDREKQKFSTEEAEKARASKKRAGKEAKPSDLKPAVDPSSRKR
jgi:hypothetical protein